MPTLGRMDSLARCLRSLVSQSILPSEIIIVSSNTDISRNGLDDIVGKRVELRVLYSAVPNASKQKNMGAAECSGDIVHFLDDDVVVFPDYIERIEETYREQPEVAGVGGRVVSLEKNAGCLHMLIARLFMLNRVGGTGPGHLQASGFPVMPNVGRVTGPIRTGLLMGCSSYRRWVFREYGYDEEMGRTHMWEDLALPLQLSRDHVLLIQPMAVLIHMHDPIGRPRQEELAYRYAYNHHYLAKVYGSGHTTNPVAFAWSHLGVWMAMIARTLSARYSLWLTVSALIRAEGDWRRRQRHGFPGQK